MLKEATVILPARITSYNVCYTKLLRVPLRSSDGTVFGVCGIEVSDRMFKQQYSPQESDYNDVFTVAAPASNNMLQS